MTTTDTAVRSVEHPQSDADPQSSQAITGEIPVIDMGAFRAGEAGALEEVAEKFRVAFTEVGFLFLVNHGFDDRLVADTFVASRELMGLPVDAKMRVRMNEHQCGWQPPKVAVYTGVEDGNRKPFASEAFKFTYDLPPDDPDFGGHKRFRGHNQWPDELSPWSKNVLERYLVEFDGFAKGFLPVVATALGLPPDHFDAHFERSSSMVRLAYYPVVPVEDGQLGAAGHTDVSFLSFIPPATAPGLQILTRDGEWVDQPQVPGGILVNTGVALRRWANDRLIATPHRVLASTKEDRYSNIFFFYPSVDAVMDPCAAPGTEKRYPPITFGQHHADYSSAHFAYAEKRAGAAD